MFYTFSELKEKYNWDRKGTLTLERQISYAASHGVEIRQVSSYPKVMYEIINEDKQFFTQKQIREKYNWVSASSSNDFVKFAELRGVTLKKQTFCKSPIYYEIVQEFKEEEWRPCVSSDLFEVSKTGKVRNKQTKKLIGTENHYGYIQVKDCYKNKIFLVHRLVMEAFNPVENMSSLYVDHINGCRQDNRLENLRWATAKDNMVYRQDNWSIIQDNINLFVQKYGYDEANRILSVLIEKDIDF